MKWTRILKIGQQYSFGLGNEQGLYMQFLATVTGIDGDIVTVMDFEDGVGHFDAGDIRYASEVSKDRPLPAAVGTEPDGKEGP